jgi:ubiquinone/menaquinone biosynthesis C-methylase UbiE
MLKIAGERSRYDNISFTRQDMCDIDFRDESFDIVTGSYALRNALI